VGSTPETQVGHSPGVIVSTNSAGAGFVSVRTSIFSILSSLGSDRFGCLLSPIPGRSKGLRRYWPVPTGKGRHRQPALSGVGPVRADRDDRSLS